MKLKDILKLFDDEHTKHSYEHKKYSVEPSEHAYSPIKTHG